MAQYGRKYNYLSSKYLIMIKKKKLDEDKIIIRRLAQKEQVAVIWTRVSTAEQYNKNYSVENQRKACIEYYERNNIRIKKDDYGATNESAKVEGELFLNMIADILLDPEINRVVVYDFDRFSRNSVAGITTKAKLKKSGIIVSSINQPIDQNNFLADAIENILIILADIDNAMRRHKCGEGMKACINRGEWYSKPPMGYDSRKVGKTHIITVNETGKLLREAFLWKANENLSNVEILRRLEARGLKLYKQRLTEIFRNVFYCGKIQHQYLGDRIIDGKQEKLVSQAIFDKVQENLSGNHDRYEQREITPEFPLKRHVLCPEHGKPYTGYIASKNKKGYYKCNIKGCGSNVAAETMHQRYAALLAEYIVPDELKGILENVIQRKFKQKNEKAYQEKEVLSKRINEIETKRKNLRKKFAFDDIDKDTFKVALEELESQKGILEKELKMVEGDLSNLAEYASSTIAICSKLGNLWNRHDFELCQKIQKLVHPQGIEWDKEKGCYRTFAENKVFEIFRTISANYRNIWKQKADNSVELSALVAGGGLEPPTFGL